MPNKVKCPVDDATCLLLELHSALCFSPVPSGYLFREWVSLLEPFPPRYKRLIVLRGLSGLSFKEVGERLGGIHQTTVWRMWRKVENRLRNRCRTFGMLDITG